VQDGSRCCTRGALAALTSPSFVGKLWTSAIAGGLVGWGLKLWLPQLHPIVAAALILGPYGLTYFAMTFLLRVPETSSALGRLRRR
jgi:putative peptidoglycan lipid II flippase